MISTAASVIIAVALMMAGLVLVSAFWPFNTGQPLQHDHLTAQAAWISQNGSDVPPPWGATVNHRGVTYINDRGFWIRARSLA